jgi:integrase
VALAGLRPEHLDALYADLLRSGRRDGGAMSPATVQRIHGVVRRALTVGVRWGWLTANPAFIAMPPRSTRRPITPPAPSEVARLIDAADPDLGVFVLLAATTGARRGELCGLRWSEIDLTEQLVEVTRAIIIVDGNCQDAPTKTRQTRRVALDPVTVEALRAQRRRSENRASLAARGLRSDRYVFSHVSGRLGHSLASTTLNVYAAFVPDADRHAANVMGRLVTGAAAA